MCNNVSNRGLKSVDRYVTACRRTLDTFNIRPSIFYAGSRAGKSAAISQTSEKNSETRTKTLAFHRKNVFRCTIVPRIRNVNGPFQNNAKTIWNKMR